MSDDGQWLDLEYYQSSGHLVLCSNEGGRCILARGYSGAPGYVNDPRSEGKIAKGPIPKGVWKLGHAVDHKTLGPVAIPLEPVEVPSLRRSGRSGFYIHGDNAKNDRSASRGCIVVHRATREAIRALGIRVLTVVI